MSRPFRVRNVVEQVYSRDTTRRGSKQRSADNVVWLDCGHIAEVTYWCFPNHYRIGDRCRCYQCGKNAPTTTPNEWWVERARHFELVRDTLKEWKKGKQK